MDDQQPFPTGQPVAPPSSPSEDNPYPVQEIGQSALPAQTDVALPPLPKVYRNNAKGHDKALHWFLICILVAGGVILPLFDRKDFVLITILFTLPALFWSTLITLMLRQHVTATEEGLVINNIIVKRHIRWSDINGFTWIYRMGTNTPVVVLNNGKRYGIQAAYFQRHFFNGMGELSQPEGMQGMEQPDDPRNMQITAELNALLKAHNAEANDTIAQQVANTASRHFWYWYGALLLLIILAMSIGMFASHHVFDGVSYLLGAAAWLAAIVFRKKISPKVSIGLLLVGLVLISIATKRVQL